MSTNWFLKTHIYVNIKKRGRIFMKKIISVLMVAVMLLGVFSLSAFAENEEPEKTWSTSYDEATGTLTVSGTGTVEGLYPDGLGRPDYDVYYKREEDDYSVKKLIIEEGITSIRISFSRLNNLTEVVLPSSLTEILGCFNNCPSLTSITAPAGVKIWYLSFFCGCDSLSAINFLGPVFIGSKDDYNFCHLPSLKTLTIPSGSFLSGAFSDCKNLSKVTLNGEVEIGKVGDSLPCYLETFLNCYKDLVVCVDNDLTNKNIYNARYEPSDVDFKIVNIAETTEAPTTKAPKPEKTTKKPSNEAPKTTQSNIKVDSQGTNENPTTTLNETTTENLTQNTSLEAPKTTEKTTIVNSQNTNEKNTDNKTIIIISVVAVIIIAGAIAVIVIKKKK